MGQSLSGIGVLTVGFVYALSVPNRLLNWYVPEGKAPVAHLDGPSEIVIGEIFQLDASGSYDPNGQPLTFHWDIDGDGTYETNAGNVSVLSVSYWDDGLYDAGWVAGEGGTIGLQVRNSLHVEDETTLAIEVLDNPLGLEIASEPIPSFSEPTDFAVSLDAAVDTFVGSVAELSGISSPTNFAITGGSGANLFYVNNLGHIFLGAEIDVQDGWSHTLTIESSNSDSSNTILATIYVLLPSQ